MWSSQRRCVPYTVDTLSLRGWSKSNDYGNVSRASHVLLWWSMSRHHKAEVLRPQHVILPAWLRETDCYSEIWAFSNIQRLFQLKQCGAPLTFSSHHHLWYCFHGMWNPQWFLLSRLLSVFVWHLHLLHVCCTARNALSYTGAGRRCWDLRGIECVGNAYKWSFLNSLWQVTEYYSPVWWT